MTYETVTAIFGWMTVLNFGILAFATLMLVAMRDRVAALHAKLLGMTSEDVQKEYFGWLATYKVLILVFAFVPWLALKLAV